MVVHSEPAIASFLENLDVGIFGGILVKKSCDLHGVMVRIVVAEESADKTYQDVSWRAPLSSIAAMSFPSRVIAAR